jgi:hypothetical protein
MLFFLHTFQSYIINNNIVLDLCASILETSFRKKNENNPNFKHKLKNSGLKIEVMLFS